MKKTTELTDEEVCNAIIALATLVLIENGNHDIKFKKGDTE